ncbi:hypothetical protein OG317_10890 [Streptomyces sp. NBC_01167]|nr:hypothetical protein OG317_10890 [Streptomyces sp. NBC_01167]
MDLLPPGAAGSNTAAELALAQVPKTYRCGWRTLICTDSGGGTHAFVTWLG